LLRFGSSILPMHTYLYRFLIIGTILIAACNTNKNKAEEKAAFLTAKDAIQLNQLIYKDSSREAVVKYAPDYEVVFLPKSVNGNYAIILKNRIAEQYALVIRGSVIKFSNDGFQNFILQDFNIFTMEAWQYADTVKGAYISQGAYIGFQNLLKLKDTSTGLSLKEFIAQKIPSYASLIITGHSLGGNLAYPLAGYLKKELPADKNKRLQLITFGAPAAGNAAFVQDLEEKFPNGERYTTNNDIATVFPDIEKIQQMAKLTGLDSVLQLNSLNISGVGKLDASSLLNIAGEILEKTNVINKSNKYVQSEKHRRELTSTDSLPAATSLSAEAIFNRAYQFHKVDMYAELLGGKKLD
jgi:Lipase (class 3)